MTTFVPKGNQSPRLSTSVTEEAGDKKKMPAPQPVANATTKTFSGWEKPGDEFVTDL